MSFIVRRYECTTHSHVSLFCCISFVMHILWLCILSTYFVEKIFLLSISLCLLQERLIPSTCLRLSCLLSWILSTHIAPKLNTKCWMFCFCNIDIYLFRYPFRNNFFLNVHVELLCERFTKKNKKYSLRVSGASSEAVSDTCHTQVLLLFEFQLLLW